MRGGRIKWLIGILYAFNIIVTLKIKTEIFFFYNLYLDPFLTPGKKGGC